MKLENGKYYHIYNCGINGCNLFLDNHDYEHFLKLYRKFIDPLVDTYAWCLMKNHFHLLVRIKDLSEIGQYKYTKQSYKKAIKNGELQTNTDFNDIKWLIQTYSKNESKAKIPDPTNHFAHLFNSYAKHFNIKYERHGSLFEHSFKRKEINHEKYFTQLIIYIHNNPIKHGFAENQLEWGWSSYLHYLSDNSKSKAFKYAIKQFGDKQNFIATHDNKKESTLIENMLGVI